MPNNVLFKKVATLEEVANCKSTDIVFCEATGEVYTHNSRYGAPTISEIGDENPNGDIEMLSDESTVMMKSSYSEPQPEPNSLESVINLNSYVVNDTPALARAGYIRYNGESYPLDEFSKMDLLVGVSIEGIHVNENTIIDMKDSGISEWGMSGIDVMSNKCGNLNDALNDMNGGKNSSILTMYKSDVFNVVEDGWYVPSLGEINEMHKEIDNIQKSLTRYGTPLLNSYYWSSTSGLNNESAWAYDMSSGSGQLGYRTSKLAVRRFKKI